MLTCSPVFAQEKLFQEEITLVVEGFKDSPTVTYTLEAIGTLWANSAISKSYKIAEEIVTGNSINQGRKGWRIFWEPAPYDPFAHGFYKLKTNINTNYAYLDFRDCQFANQSFTPNYSTDFEIKYNAVTDKFSHKDHLAPTYTEIPDKGIVRIWEIKNGIPTTTCFQDFWQNCLVIIDPGTDNPQLIWGPIPDFEATGYKIYRAIGNSSGLSKTNYSLIETTSANTFDYIDEDIDLSDSQYVFYYVAAYNSAINQNSELTNLVCTKNIENTWKASLLVETSLGINPHLYWQKHPTFTTTNYKIYRAISSVSNPRTLTYNLIHTTASEDIFEYTDQDVAQGNSDYVFYYVAAYNSNTNSTSEPSNVVTTRGGMYKQNQLSEEHKTGNIKYELSQNTPNPFNPSTTISFTVPSSTEYYSVLQNVTLKVYNILGNEVATLVDENKPAGNYEVKFDGSNLASGIYFYKLQSGSFAQTKKLLLLK